MPIPQLPGALNTVDDIKNYIIRLERELRFLMESGLDSTNAFEFGGWRVKDDMIVSKDADVGMSTADTAADDVRFFAGPNGDVWFYYVTKTGKLYATDAFITGRVEGSIIVGSEIKTSETAYPRIELSSLGTFFKALGSADKSIEISVSTDGTAGLFFKDPIGSALIHIGSSSFGILSTIAMLLSAPTVSAVGIWTFNNTINGNITGHAASADFADHAGTASAADTLAPSGEIAWGQVLKSGSNIADLEVKNLSALTQNTSYRTVSDAYMANWNTVTEKASKTLPPWTPVTLSNSWVDFGSVYATAGRYKDDLSIVRLKGLIKNGITTAGTTLFTLPAGERPSLDIVLHTISNNAGVSVPIAIEVSAAGVVKIGAFNAGSTWLSLDGLSFRAEL